MYFRLGIHINNLNQSKTKLNQTKIKNIAKAIVFAYSDMLIIKKHVLELGDSWEA